MKYSRHRNILSMLIAVMVVQLSAVVLVDAANYVVDRNDDDPAASACTAAANDCTLRGAVSAASADAVNDVITFDPAVFALNSVIALSNGQIRIMGSGTVRIDGSGARFVTVDGQRLGGVFFVAAGTTAEISHLTITGGNLFFTFGGGIDNRGNLTLSYSTVNNNSGGSGAGIFNQSGQLTVRNSTICNNQSGFGGAVHNVGSTAVTDITDSTLCSNTSNFGGGIYVSSGTVRIGNTIVANNSAATRGPDIFGTVVSLGYNLISDTANAVINGDATGNQLNADPLLDPAGLQDNGGNTRTVQLLPGSPAIDAGNSVLADDQRNLSRPVDEPNTVNGTGNLADIGAVEVQGPAGPMYEFSGFFPPIRNDEINVARAGSAIPIKFSLGGFQGMDIFADGSPSSEETVCKTLEPGGLSSPIETPGKSALAYDAKEDTYSIVWKTQQGWSGTCRRLNVELDDGSVHTADFLFK